MTNASTNPMLNTTTNKNKTYLGALDVILKILFGSKSLNISLFKIFFGDFYYEIVFWSRMQRGDNKIEINV